MANKTTLERTLETLVELFDLHRKQTAENFDKVNASIEKVNASIEALTLSIGQLTTQQKVTAANIDHLTQAVREQNAAINGHLAVAQAQSANIAELTKLLTVMIANR